jgi:hypothetical protein
MKIIHLRQQIVSETLHIPELREMIGKTADIVVRVEPAVSSPATEDDWREFFAEAGRDLIDPDLYRDYREFDRGQIVHRQS